MQQGETPGNHACEDRTWRSGRVKVRYCKALVGSRISHGITQINRQLRLSIDRSEAWLAISHPSPLQNVEGILPLVKEQARRAQTGESQQ